MKGKNQVIELQEEIYKLELKIQEYEKRNTLYEKILDKIDEAIYAYDENTRLIYMNSASEKIEGRRRENLIGKKETEIWDTNEVQPLIEGQKSIENKRMYYEIPGGKVVHIVHSMYPYYKENKVEGVFSITKDVTEIDNMIMNIYEIQRKIRSNEKNKTFINGTRYNLNDIIGESGIMRKCVNDAYKVARHQSNILIYGETGTGKELFAQGIHNAGCNYKKPFIGINCSAIPSNLLESLLFGTKQGAFTGALDTNGLFEQAGEGTLFLDEINSMPIDMQPKLLRVLQEKKYRRIGDTEDKPVRCRVISSTNIEPSKAKELGQIRQDLYYRIATVTITIPPLRERASDVYLLIYYFMNKYNKVFNTTFRSIDRKLIDACNNYHWPGNVRELQHMIERALNLSEACEKVLTLDMFPKLINNKSEDNQKEAPRLDCFLEQEEIDLNKRLNDYENELIKGALLYNRGNIAATARQLSIHRSVLYNKMKRLNISLDKFTEVN